MREKERNLFDLGQRDFGKFRLLVWEGGSSQGSFFFFFLGKLRISFVCKIEVASYLYFN